MSLFSIIVPVYNVRAYLRECLDSILDQSFGDFELIAVDDRSPDDSGRILDEYAAADQRVRVLHLEVNVGLGLAREAGIAEATGDYLLFVDSDDKMTAGSLKAIADRIAATERPDIVIFDYARRFWWNADVRNQLAHLLAAKGPEVFTIDERPELLELLMVVWNKAYRRDFVTAGGFHFPPGYYEDTPWTYPTLLAAKRITVLNRVCMLYRQRRQGGSILTSLNRKHFEIYDQWDRVFAFLGQHPELESWRPFLLRRMLEHVVTILGSGKRLPHAAKAEFFHRAAAHYRTYRGTEPVDRGAGMRGRRVGLVMRDAYRTYAALQLLARFSAVVLSTVKKLKTRARRSARSARQTAFRMYYRFHLRRPLDENLAAYAAYWYRDVTCNPAAVYFKARELAPAVRGVWIIKAPATARIPDGVEWVRPETFAYYRLLARAKYLVNNANFPDLVEKRPGSVHLQTHHGTPLKKMGLDLHSFPVGANRMNFSRLLKRCDRWDFSISTNRFSSEIWERAYPCRYETLETGYPRNDRLVRATDEERGRLRAEFGIGEGQTAVLYAPTFRDYRNTFVPEFDFSALLDALGPDGVLLTRIHYFNDDEDDRETIARLTKARRVIDVSTHPSVEDLAIASDCLLTDYSSVMFDYALLGRPIVIFAYDWDTYARTRGVNFDLPSEPPGIVATTAEDLYDAFRSGAVWEDRAAKALDDFRRRFCEFDKGDAAELVVRRVFLGEALPPRRQMQSSSAAAEPATDPVKASDSDAAPIPGELGLTEAADVGADGGRD